MYKRAQLLSGSLIAMFVAATIGLAVAAGQAGAPTGADDGTAASAKSHPLIMPAGFVAKDLNETNDVRDEFATLTNDAMKTGGFDSFVNNFVDQDRKRIGDFKDRKFEDLDGKINVIRKSWKDKYGKDFKIGDARAVYGDQLAILTGEVTDSRQAAANWPLDPKTGFPMSKTGEAIQAAAREADKPFGGQVNLDKGRNVAAARMPESHGLPEVTASLIHEAPDQWRIDIPNDRTGQNVHDDLLHQLAEIADHSAQWPNDINDAYRMVTHRVVMAAYGAHGPPASDRTTDKPAGQERP